MEVAVLSSGSKGNSTFIKTENTKILIDLGVTKSYIEEKLKEIEEEPKEISAILITHTHVDHIQGLKVFLKKYDPKLYVTEKIKSLLVEYGIEADYVICDKNFSIGDIDVEIIKTSHDAPGSVGFIISSGDKSLVYITDTGYINERYFDSLKNHNLYIMESNHNIEMLIEGSYPDHLKRRIWGDKGHLSNEAAGEYLSMFIGESTKTIVLAHISDDNNTYDQAYTEVFDILKKKNKKVPKIIVAKQKQRTDLIEV